MPLLPGARLGPYEIVARLGEGGMGDVYKALDTRLNRIVAIKHLKDPRSTRFEQEARAIAALNHPHICRLYDIGPDYLVMEYIDGTRLRGPVPADEAVRLASQIASALAAAHQRGILHRDLKPANVMVSNGAATLLDFGLAKVTADGPDITRTADGAFLGTVAYAPPEQAQGRPVDERADIFSFGAVLHELLSGERAFAGTSAAEVVSAVLRDEPRPLSASQASPSLAAIVTRCLRKAPADRFQRISDVVAALDRLSEPVEEQSPSIAVLPFADMSPGKDQEYFSDGLAEEIINALAHIKGLKVIARTSAFSFKGQNTDIRRIAEILGVATVLEGSVRKAGSRIRVTAQLITAADGSHLWSERYDRELEDVFAVQDDIAAAIVRALTATLALGATPARQHRPVLAAYEAYLKGRHYLWKVTPEALASSRAHFEQAIAADPGYALPHAGLSRTYFFMAIFSMMPAHDVMPRLREEAQRALALDASLPDAHVMLAVVDALYDYDWPAADRRFSMALAIEPVSSDVRETYALFYLLYSGRAAEGAETLRLALTEDPVSLSLRYGLGACLLCVGRYDEAADAFGEVLAMDPNFVTAVALLAMTRLAQGNTAEAQALAERARALAPWDPAVIPGLLAGIVARAGDTTRARALLAPMANGEAFGAPIGLATYHLLVDDIVGAADWFEKAVDQRYPGTLWFIRMPIARALRASARWPALARRMNLPV